MNIRLIIAFTISLVLIGWAFWIVSRPADTDTPTAVSMVDGTQIIDLTAKGGYFPREVVAAAGVPTVLRVRTTSTFDCSASLVIPKLSYQKFLAPSGTEEISIPAEQAQGTLQGLCSMGMYGFQIKFE
jgi:plastocyanin domain-containing protein